MLAREWSANFPGPRVIRLTPLRQRILGVAVAALIGCGAIAAYVVFLMRSPETVAAPARTGAPVELTLQTVAALGPRYAHPDWVSYLVQNDEGEWVHSTHLRVPANSLVRLTIHQYDSATGLRNPFFARPQGISRGVMRVDGKEVDVIDPNLASHTFAIPQLGVFVPLPGVADNAPNQCAAAPCTLDQAHRTITFEFRTGKPGRYRWQCFVPCAAGFVLGFGGPMQSFGYMDGYLDVV
jgi:hypothetical protein